MEKNDCGLDAEIKIKFEYKSLIIKPVRLLKSYTIWVQIDVSQIGFCLWKYLNYLYERIVVYK